MILVIGDTIIDQYMLGQCSRISPEAPVPVIENPKTFVSDGGAKNVFNNVVALGSECRLITDTVNIAKKTRILGNGHIICRVDEERYTPFFPHIEEVSDVKYAILSDYNKGVIHDPTRLISLLNEKGIKVLVDVKKPFEKYRGAWLVKANKKEFHAEIDEYLNINYEMHCQYFRSKYNIENFVITLGEEGLILSTPDKTVLIRSTKKSVEDVTGAGDVVIAALAHYIDQGKSLEKSCELANKLAGISVSHLGTYVLTKDDIRSVEQKIVFTNGCFDILHVGHINLLFESKKLGDHLIVGLNSDASIQRLKGSSRPVNSQENRKKLLESISCVDEVIIFEDDTPYELIRRLKPDIITKGGDYTTDQVVGNDLANVVIIPLIEGVSTSKVIHEIKRCG